MSDLERLLAETLRDAGEGYDPSDPVEARRRFLERARRRRWYGFVQVAAVGGVAVAALFFFTRPSTEENVNRPQVPAGAPEVVARVAVLGEPVSIDSTSGSEVWVAAGDRLVAIDPEKNKPTTMIIDLPADEVAVGEETLWVAHDGSGTISEVDPETGTVEGEQSVSLDAEEGTEVTWDIAADGNTLWAVDGISGHVNAFGVLSQDSVIPGYTFSDVAAGEGQVWVLDQSQGRVLKMDPVPAGDESYEFTVPAGKDADLAAGLSYVWVSPGDGTLVRVDPATGDNTELDLGDSYMDLTVHEKSVWALVNVDEEHKQLFEVNPGTMEVIGEPLQIEGDANDVVAEAGSVWVADGGGEVLRIEPARDTEDDAPPPAEDETEEEPSLGVDPDEIAFVYSANGDIRYETFDGETGILTPSGDIEQHPAFAPDGQSILFERIDTERGDGDPFIIQMDLATGEEKAIGNGAWPTLAPDGRLGWVHADMTAEGLRSAILISESPGGPGKATEVGTAELPNISNLSWSPDGERLVWQASGEGSVIKEAAVDGIELGEDHTLVPSEDSGSVESEDFEPGSNLVSPRATSDGAVVLRLCCRETEGDGFEYMEFGRVEQQTEGVVYEDLAPVSGNRGIEPEFGVELVLAGRLTLERDRQDRWVLDPQAASWFLFDDDSLWMTEWPIVDAEHIAGEKGNVVEDPLIGHEGETDFRGLAVHPLLD